MKNKKDMKTISNPKAVQPIKLIKPAKPISPIRTIKSVKPEQSDRDAIAQRFGMLFFVADDLPEEKMHATKTEVENVTVSTRQHSNQRHPTQRRGAARVEKIYLRAKKHKLQDWRLNEETRRIGKIGVQLAREALEMKMQAAA